MSPTPTQCVRRHLPWALLAGLILRVVLVLLCREDVLGGDAATYERLARNLIEHNTFSAEENAPFTPTVVRAPFTALALSTSYRIFGVSNLTAHALLIFVGLAGMVVLALGVGRRMPSLQVPILWSLVLSPFGGIYASRLLSETFASSAISIAVGTLLMAKPGRSAVLAGCALGVAALTRDVYLPLLVLLPLAAAALSRGTENPFRWGHVLLSIALSAAVVAPWTLRNALAGKPAVVSKGLMGVNLWIGTWERNPKWMHGEHDYPAEAYDSPQQARQVAELRRDPADGDATFRKMAIERMKSQPGRTLAVWLLRAPYLWIGSRAELFEFRPDFLARGRPAWTLVKSAAWGLNLLVLAFSILGAAFVVKARHPLSLLLVPVLFTALVYLPFHSTENRYSEPVFALVVVLAILGASAARHWVRSLASAYSGGFEAGDVRVLGLRSSRRIEHSSLANGVDRRVEATHSLEDVSDPVVQISAPRLDAGSSL